MRKIIILLSLLLTINVYADDYVDLLKPLYGVNKRDMKVTSEDDVDIYTKKRNNRGDYYFYVLLHYNKVVYCGITNDPKRRVGEHQELKTFSYMVAAGKTTESKARRLEQACVCMYDPKLNKLPKADNCPYIYMTGGGSKYGIE